MGLDGGGGGTSIAVVYEHMWRKRTSKTAGQQGEEEEIGVVQISDGLAGICPNIMYGELRIVVIGTFSKLAIS